MIELAIDTGSGALSVALIDGDRLLAERHDVIGRGHAEAIVGVVADVVGGHGGTVRGIVVGVGPGSFTGVRIGIAAARALGFAWDVPVVGVGSLALIAAAAFAVDLAATIVAVADAGRGRVYWQVFARDDCRPLTLPVAGDETTVVVPSGAAIAGSGATGLAGRRVAVTHPRAADARRLDHAARTIAAPLYIGAAT